MFSPEYTRVVDPVAIGRELTGQELNAHTANKAWYATVQMNVAQTQAEGRLMKMAADNKKAKEQLTSVHQERKEMKHEIDELLGGMQK